jgi:DHA1 family multidrug resistance protein-like MFS transporter
MTELLREAPLGQLLRWVTGNRVLKYPEELPGYELPATYTAVLNASDNAEDSAASRTLSNRQTKSSRRSSGDEASPAPGTLDLEKKETENQHSRDDVEALSLSRTKSRLETTPYTEERLEIETELALERTQTKPIVPQKTSDGNILVDWYTTDDPANPQNWSNLKRFFISLIICLYTFVVYSGSAIYTSSEQGVMERFNVGPTAASLPLSLYVLAYGIGPLLWSPLSEIPIIGRSPVYAATMALFTILSLPTALVDNFAGLLVLRFLQGFLGSPCLATGAATMQDMYSLLYLPFAL